MTIDQKSIPPYMFNLLIRVLEGQGHAAAGLVDGTGVRLEKLQDQSTRISFRQSQQMIRNAYRISQNPALGLAVAQQVNIADWGMLGYAIASCSNLQESLMIGQRYNRAATRLTDNSVSFGKNTFSLLSTPLFAVGEEEPFFIEEDLGGVINLLHLYLGRNANPKRVHFRYYAPSYHKRYAEHFACPVHFECEFNEIVWDIADIKQPLPASNPAATRLAIVQCEQLIADVPGAAASGAVASGAVASDSDEIIDRVRAIIVQKPGEFASIKKVSSALNMSESTLRRALIKAGTSYQTILNGIRKKMAVEYLSTSDLKLEDIAYLVGYSDLSNFRRAFRQWTDRPPLSYRGKR